VRTLATKVGVRKVEVVNGITNDLLIDFDKALLMQVLGQVDLNAHMLFRERVKEVLGLMTK
jgi:hypothetical protein